MCKICNVEGCEKEVLAKGYCSKHYAQVRKYGHILENSSRDPNIIKEFDDHAEIYLYNKNYELIGKALIDLDDIDKIKKYRWHLRNNRNKNFYVECSNPKTSLHRIIMNVSDSNIIVDHINRNPLDNRKSNLRLCSDTENKQNCDISKNNKSGCKGVYWSKDKNKWTVQIGLDGKTKYIGRFSNYEDAVNARIEATEKYYKEFSNDREVLKL